MNNFEFYNPVHIVFGAGEINRAGALASQLGKQALLVSYQDQPVFDGLIETISSSLRDAGVGCTAFRGVNPNPKISEIEAGVAVARASGADLVIGLGGGSAMDAAKLIAAGVFYPGDLWDMVFSRHDNSCQAVPPTEALPLMMIPTLPATGSEMNPTAVVTNERTTEKSYTWDACLYPKVSLVDPALTCTLSPYQTACGVADTLSHVLEFYLTGFEDAFLNNRLQEGVMLTVMEYAPKVFHNPGDVSSRAHLQWAAIVALNGWSQPGDGWTPMHQLGHVLSARYNIAHGASLAIVMPAWMRHFYRTRLWSYETLAERIFGVNPQEKTGEQVALEGITRFKSYLKDIGIEVSLSQVGVTAGDIPSLVEDVVKVSFGADGMLRSRPPATRQDITRVFELALNE